MSYKVNIIVPSDQVYNTDDLKKAQNNYDRNL